MLESNSKAIPSHLSHGSSWGDTGNCRDPRRTINQSWQVATWEDTQVLMAGLMKANGLSWTNLLSAICRAASALYSLGYTIQQQLDLYKERKIGGGGQSKLYFG